MTLKMNLLSNTSEMVKQADVSLDVRKPDLLHAYNKGADKLMHRGRLIGAFVICFLKRVTANLAPCKMFLF